MNGPQRAMAKVYISRIKEYAHLAQKQIESPTPDTRKLRNAGEYIAMYGNKLSTMADQVAAEELAATSAQL